MMDRLRELLRGPMGKALTVILLALAGYALWSSLSSTFGDSEAIALSKSRTYVCSESGKSFTRTVEPGTDWPVESPYSGKRTGYPAEPCYWTKEGTIKSDPTWVLVKQYLKQNGPTFCPDCGRLVQPQNPPPIAGSPPPTETEYKAKRVPDRP